MTSLQFHSLQELFWMNGHGPYVWSAYAIVLVALIFLVWSPLARRKRFFRDMRSAQRRQIYAEKGTAPGQVDDITNI